MDEALIREGDAWVILMASGDATEADASALQSWRARSPAHESAFRKAARLRKQILVAGHAIRAREAAAAAALGATARTPPRINRRMVMTGAVAASAAGVAILVGGRSAGLFGGEAAEFATRKGERRNLQLAEGVTAELNTATRLSRRPDIGPHAVELLEGEVVLTAAVPQDAPLIVLAANGRAVAHDATLSVRCAGDEVSVTCFTGAVRVEAAGASETVPPRHQLTYNSGGMGRLVAVDPSDVTAWRRGMLVFRGTRVGDVVAEINRYRDGRILVTNRTLADRRIHGVFYIGQFDEIFEQLRSAYGANVSHLPGGVVVIA